MQTIRFDEDYYCYGFGGVPYERNSHWLSFFAGICDQLIHGLQPRRVMDAGCAWGFLVEAFRDRGIEAWGVDISEYAIARVRDDMRPYCRLTSLSDPIPNGPFDLITCIEVLEHIPPGESGRALDNLCAAGERIVFSSTPSDFDEPTHVNVRPVIDWLKEFAQRGFRPLLGFDASFISPHAFVVSRSEAPCPPGGLELLAETLRLRGERAAFLTRHNELLQLHAERLRLHGDLSAARAQSQELREALDQANRAREQSLEQGHETQLTLDASRLALASEKAVSQRFGRALEDLRGQLQAAGEESLDLRRKVSQTQDQSERLRSLMDERELALGQALAEVDLWRGRQAQASGEAQEARLAVELWAASAHDHSLALESALDRCAQLSRELVSVQASPGWQLVLRYRTLLLAMRRRHRWFRRNVDPAISGLLDRAGLRAGEAAPLWMPVPTQRNAHPQAAPLPRPAGAHGEQVARPFAAVPPAVEPAPRRAPTYAEWITGREPSAEGLAAQKMIAACLNLRPKFSIIVPLYRTPVAVLRDMLSSVVAQSYDHWELCLSAGRAEDALNLSELEGWASRDSRIRVRSLDRNEGIASSSNAALELASGDYLVLLDHDDTLAPSALYEFAKVINEEPDVAFLYSDKDQITDDGTQRVAPLFKPSWSPELMWNANYLTHLCAMRTSDVRAVGGWRRETDGAQDWDLFLRVIRRGGTVRHVPHVLYHWRQLNTSVAAGGLDAKPYAADGQVRAVADHCSALGLRVEVTRADTGDLHLIWPWLPGWKASVVLTGCRDGAAQAKAEQLARDTAPGELEILFAADAAALPDDRLRPVRVGPDWPWERQVEKLAAAATGNLLVLLDANCHPDGATWLLELCGPLQLADIGLVGARLLDATTRVVRHAGLVVTADGAVESIYEGYPEHVYEVFGGAGWYRNWSAVSGGCMALRLETWRLLGGLGGPQEHPRLDVHLCLKLTARTGLRILYNPFATLLTRGEPALSTQAAGSRDQARTAMRARFPEGDPYFHRDLTCRNGAVEFVADVAGHSVKQHDYSAESSMLVQWFDATPKTVRACKASASVRHRGGLRTVNWILPEFSHPFYGGIHTILRFADAFRRGSGVESRFCFLGDVDTERMKRLIGSAFPALAASPAYRIKSVDSVNDLPECDAGICTLWTTAYPLVAFEKARRKFYFMQDDEALFYPAGSTSALVEATYRFGFTALCNTESLLTRYERAGGRGAHFSPCVDTAVFHARNRRAGKSGDPLSLFCYARPHHPRNCFELVAESLRKLKDRMGAGLRIYTAGEEWDPERYGLREVVHNLGLLDYRTTGALYRACDAGIALMMTRHPSYLPLELMACGALVVTNRNPDTGWLLRDEENCLLAEPTPSGVAERLEEGLRNATMRQGITARAAHMIESRFADWDGEASKVLRFMSRELEGE